MRKVKLARQWVLSTILTVSFSLFIIMGSNTLILETRIQDLTQSTFDKYLETKIESMELSSYQFASSIDSLFEGYIVSLNNTANFISHQLYSNETTGLYEKNHLELTNSDETLYFDGTVNATVRREEKIGYFDFFNDGTNILDTPGLVVFGDIKDEIFLQGIITAQINASLTGELATDSSLFLYYYNNNSEMFSINISDVYQSYFHKFFNVTLLESWNDDPNIIPQVIKSKMNFSEFSFFKQYYVLNSYQESNITLIRESELSRIEGCVSGNFIGQYKGLLKGNINGTLNGFIDLRPKYIYQHFPSLRQSFLQWVYYATPNYFIVYPFYPNFFDSEHILALSIEYNWLKRPWYNEILAQENNETVKGIKAHFSSLGVDYVLKNLFISLGQAIYNSTDYQGLLVQDFNLDFLKNALELRITQEDFNWLVDNSGNILYSPEYFEKEDVSILKPYPISNIFKLNNSAISNSFIEAKEGKISHIELTFNDTSYLVFYRKLVSPNWWMIHFSPVDLILEEIQPLTNEMEKNFKNVEVMLLVTSFVILSIVGGVEIFLTRNYTKNLTKLRKAIYRVSSGDYSVSFDFNREKLNEITEVFFLFEEMAIKLNDSMEKEKQSTILANLALDLFIHDIGNYLHALNGYLELVSVNSEVEEMSSVLEKIGRVLEKTERLRDRIIVLRSLSTKKLSYSKVNLKQQIKKALENMKIFYPQFTIDFIQLFEDDFSIYACNYFVDLLENVFEFFIKQSQTKKVVIRICAVMKDNYVEIDIEGKGKGLSHSRKTQIQEELSTGRRLSDFNLITAYMIVKRSGGSIVITDRVEGKLGEGSKLILKIPKKILNL
ncbi:MAG: sensor histidine kinase [Candidatus Heimdallarchaeum endolithica]|uniref:histidine kinase n=1 Tax=Candidatus Heimdallarchaeum endolithica TaxID=2876572 RepID=A0A9Y1BRT3_9ARCH|nr:MAG: sensor histidine kinase [Candidatus Heimdallarchaeum endolithica]